MPETNDPIREYLLGQTPDPNGLPLYREGVRKLLRDNDSRIRRERVLAMAAWIFCAVSAAAWIWSTPEGPGWPRAPFLACLFMIVGAVELLKHQINSSRVHLLAELKQLQVQLFELEQRVQKTD